MAEKLNSECVDIFGIERLVMEAPELEEEVDELKDAFDAYVDESTAVLSDDEMAEKLDSECVDIFGIERLVMEAPELEEEVDELKDAFDTYVDESTAVLPDDEMAEKLDSGCVDTFGGGRLVMEPTELEEKVDELRDAIDTYVDEGTAVLPDDELTDNIIVDCVDTIADEGLIMEAIELTGEVDKLKDAIDTYVDEGTAVLPDDELTDNIIVDCVDTIADEGLVMEATELTGEVGIDMVEVFNGLVAQEVSLRYPLTVSAYGVPSIALASEAVAS